MRRRRFLYVLSGGLLWSVAISRGSSDVDPSLARVRQAGVLRVGLDPSYPPFANYDGNGQIAGFDVDLARETAKRLGVSPTLTSLDSGSLLDAIVARKCDVAVGVPPARELLTDLRYSRPYFEGGQVLVARKDAQSGGSGPRIVGVESGSEGDLQWARIARKVGNVEPRRYTTQENLVAALAAGQVSTALLDGVAARQTISRLGGLAIASAPLTSEPTVMAVHKDDASLLQGINTVLATLDGEGFLNRLADQWMR